MGGPSCTSVGCRIQPRFSICYVLGVRCPCLLDPWAGEKTETLDVYRLLWGCEEDGWPFRLLHYHDRKLPRLLAVFVVVIVATLVVASSHGRICTLSSFVLLPLSPLCTSRKICRNVAPLPA